MRTDVLVAHPNFGSKWLLDCEIKENGIVTGTCIVTKRGANLPTGQATMKRVESYPKSYIQKVSKVD